MSQKGSVISVISFMVSLATLALIIFMVTGDNLGDDSANSETAKELAGELADNNLYRASIEEYRQVLVDETIDNDTRANVNYLIGKTYYDNLKDYENAAAYMVRARTLNPNGSFYNEAGRMLVESLEKMGRMLDARRELDREVNIDSVKAANEGKTMVAKINDLPIYLDDVEEQIQLLPAEMQQKFGGRDNKLQAVQNYIGEKLIYRAAVREGFDRDPEVLKMTDMMGQQIVVDKFVSQKILGDIKIDQSDIRNFYEANKDDMFGGKPFSDVRQDVIQAYQKAKAGEAFKNYVGKLMKAENVQIFESKIK